MHLSTVIKTLTLVGIVAFSASRLDAETVADLVLADRVFDAAVDGVMSEFNCATPRQTLESLTSVYESVVRESEPAVWTVVLAKFMCAGVSVELTYSWDEGDEPFGDDLHDFGSADFRHNNLPAFFSSKGEVGEILEELDTLGENSLVSEISRALMENSGNRCAPIRWTIGETAIVKDPSGIPSRQVRGLLDCGPDPDDQSCDTSHSFSGSYYPSRALFILERVQSMRSCA